MSKIVWKTSFPSTAFIKGVGFSQLPARKCSLEYFYESEMNDLVFSEKLIFNGVESYKCTYYKACSIEMIAAYDRVFEVKNSEWLNEIKRSLTKNQIVSNDLKHLRIYFDDGPCYEFICKSFEATGSKHLPETFNFPQAQN